MYIYKYEHKCGNMDNVETLLMNYLLINKIYFTQGTENNFKSNFSNN